MIPYLLQRMVHMVGVACLSSILIYFLLYLAPGGPLAGINQSANQRARLNPEQIQRLEEYLGLHRGPIWGYVVWLIGEDWLPQVGRGDLQRPICRENVERCRWGVLRGDFGVSWAVTKGVAVSSVLQSRLRNTLLLTGLSIFFSLLIATPIGIYSATHQYSKTDHLLTFFAFFGSAMPAFWFGLTVIILFGGPQSYWHQATGLPYLPPGNVALIRAPLPGSLHALLDATPRSWLDTAIHLILPVSVLSLRSMAGWSRFMRSSMLEVLRQDYVRTARAKGLAEQLVLYKHALGNALLPLITLVVFTLPALFGGAVIIETIFNWQGMGYLFVRALAANDYPVVMAILFLSTLLTLFATFLGDILYTIADPRIRFN